LADTFEQAFRRALLAKFPQWQKEIAESAETGKPITIQPKNWTGPPLTIDARCDTVTVAPLCNFGLDYTSTATVEDLEQRSDLVFRKVLTDIDEFVAGRTVVSIKRNRFLFVKAGWDVQFIPSHDKAEAPGLVRSRAQLRSEATGAARAWRL
jgi:hypothetical protein